MLGARGTMARIFGDAENYASREDRYDQLPRWFKHSVNFRRLTGTDALLYVLLVWKQDQNTHITPAFRLTELECILPINRNRIREGFINLAALGLITLKPRKDREPYQAQLLFRDPDATPGRVGTKVFTSKQDVVKLPAPSEARINSSHPMPSDIASDARKDGMPYPPDWDLVEAGEEDE